MAKPTITAPIDADRIPRLERFVAWCQQNIKGDEKGEAQIFLDHLFQGFGWPGLKEAGAVCEMKIKKEAGGVSFADLVWKPVVLIEMKKRETDLARHYRQAFDYWTRLVPNRPRYAVLCNFENFWVYDFENQMDTPVDKLTLAELPTRWGALAFLFPTREEPVFGNSHVAVTQAAADMLATCFTSMVERGVDRDLAQRFTLQTLVALFAEDIGLLSRYFFQRLLDECAKPEDTFDVLGGLFDAMNTGGKGGRFKGVRHFNGGLFANPARVELAQDELSLLRLAATQNWAKVGPEIFGSLFQHSLGAQERRAVGAHFTSPSDIMRVVTPTIVEPWGQAIDAAKTLKDLRQLLARIFNFRVLDPACGSGNFLYIAYRELKRIEARIHQRMADEFKSVDANQRPFGFLTAKNFFGIDITPFAVEIAKVTMVLARKLAIDELHITEDALPLANLDDNFVTGDALMRPDGSRTPWRNVDVIVGNPPFTGAKWLKRERGPDYVKALRRAYPEVPGMADYCVYWFRRAHDELKPCTAADPVTGRAGLVGTQNIRHNQSRVGGLDYITKTGTVIEAVDNEPWSGEANVNVSIANWVKTQDPTLLPKARRLLWFRTEVDGKDAGLDVRECDFINSALSDATDVSAAVRLKCNQSPQRVFQGITHGHKGFLLQPKEKEALLAKDPGSEPVIFPYLIGRELANGDGRARRYVIDFGARSILEAQAFSGAFARVRARVLPDRQRKVEQGKDAEGNQRPHHKGFLERWWRLAWDREDLKQANAKLDRRYIAASRTQRKPFIFCFVGKSFLPGDKLQTFAFDDDYSFGIIQGGPHLAWYAAKAARLKNEVDYNYSTESVFETYPWPQEPTAKQVEAVAAAAVRVREVRAANMPKKGGLRVLYGTLALPGANPLKDATQALDDAVMAAYGFSRRKDLLAQILALNRALADELSRGGTVVGPGIPPTYSKRSRLVTRDFMGDGGGVL